MVWVTWEVWMVWVLWLPWVVWMLSHQLAATLGAGSQTSQAAWSRATPCPVYRMKMMSCQSAAPVLRPTLCFVPSFTSSRAAAPPGHPQPDLRERGMAAPTARTPVVASDWEQWQVPHPDRGEPPPLSHPEARLQAGGWGSRQPPPAAPAAGCRRI